MQVAKHTISILIGMAGILLFALNANAQEAGTVKGRVLNSKNNAPVPFANIVVFETTIGTTSDAEGYFVLNSLKPGWIELKASAIGYKTAITQALLVTNAKANYIEISLEEAPIQLEDVVVKASTFRRSSDAPLSLRRIGIDEIERNPGGNRDISRVIQSLPGVASSLSYRNDVIVRGGGSNENRFYLDEVEIPNLNHFATQGSSGGPVGIINVDFIREVNFYSGAFPADKGNALSSVLDFRQVDGNKDKLRVKTSAGASDFALTLDGPVSPKSTFIFSARRSYLQFLFNALKLPFLPTYNDFQFKLKTRFDNKHELTVIGLGAIDDFELNTGLKNPDDYQQYILGYLPVYKQWSYTLGVVYKYYRENGSESFIISRNMLDNSQYKYTDNNENMPKLLDYSSWESENKFRYERSGTYKSRINYTYGAGLEYARYYNNTYRAKYIEQVFSPELYKTNLDLFKWNTFGQANQTFFKKLTLSIGVRADANNYSTEMQNLLKTVSPRFSASYKIHNGIFLNFNTGIYYQLPPYTTLGYSTTTEELVNKQNHLKYIKSNHFVTGIEWLPTESSRFSAELFYKLYHNYPVSLIDSISISSKSADYGTFGDEPVKSVGEGRTYGIELLYRNKHLWGFNTLISYTLVRSESKRMDSNLKPSSGWIPTAWDNRNLITITANRDFNKGWTMGFKWRYLGGAPYSPYNLDLSRIIEIWDVNHQAVIDYTKYNTLRYKAFHQLDLRIDKMFYYRKWTLSMYIDIQNVYNFKGDERAIYTLATDANGNPIVDSNDPSRYVLKKIAGNGSGTILPTIGIIVEF
ncbi:MAG: TonB-dependent receptor [Bacteroidales bacterium]|nr:TonB-dependent receptor [Bacteroidales bacterium]